MLRGCFDSVDSASHLNDVGIQLKDATLWKQRLHPYCVVRFESFPNPGTPLPQKNRPRALVRDRRSSTNRFPFPFSFRQREIDLLPVKTLSLIHISEPTRLL